MRIWFPTAFIVLCVSFNSVSPCGAAPAAVSPPAPAISPVPPVRPGTAMAPVTVPGQQLPPGLQNPNQLPPGFARQQSSVSEGSQALPEPSATPGAQAAPQNQVVSPQTQAIIPQNQAVTAADQTVLSGIQQAVQSRLQGFGPAGGVGFQVANGVVTLVGNVQTAAQEEQLESMVQQVPGVVGVVDRLTIAGANGLPTPATPAAGGATTAGTVPGAIGSGIINPQDQALLLRVRQSVVPQIQVAGQPVPVSFNVQQGIVTLTGTLPSMAQRDQIAFLVQQVPGVVQVNNQLLVNPAMSRVGNQNAPAAGALNNNLTPTGRPNNTTLPPVLEKQNEVPSTVPAQTNSIAQ